MVCVHAILVILVPFSPFQKKFVFLQKVLHAMKGKFTEKLLQKKKLITNLCKRQYFLFMNIIFQTVQFNL